VSQLSIDFQEGFDGQTVVLKIDKREVFHQAIITSLLIGQASSLALEVDPGKVEVSVMILELALEEMRTLEVKEQLFIGLSLGPEGLHWYESLTPFGYA
jgi:hypothetical protein